MVISWPHPWSKGNKRALREWHNTPLDSKTEPLHVKKGMIKLGDSKVHGPSACEQEKNADAQKQAM